VTSTPIEQTLLTKYSNKAVTSLENVSKGKNIGQALLERKIGGKKSKIDTSLIESSVGLDFN